MLKRAFDVVVALTALAVLWPVILLVAILVWLNLGSPVFFIQERPGLGGSPFRLVKFRTMQASHGSDAQRLTRFGRILRSTSLDELPELWNVLTGDMSLVGPRPLLMEYLSLYTPEQARRHEVRPGVTGLAQISGRNAVAWEERFRLDIRYVDSHSLWLDIKILARTLVKVLRREGISAVGETTMPKFTGKRV